MLSLSSLLQRAKDKVKEVFTPVPEPIDIQFTRQNGKLTIVPPTQPSAPAPQPVRPTLSLGPQVAKISQKISQVFAPSPSLKAPIGEGLTPVQQQAAAEIVRQPVSPRIAGATPDLVQVAKNIAQGTNRANVSIGLEVQRLANKLQPEQAVSDRFQPGRGVAPGLELALLGNEPITPFSERPVVKKVTDVLQERSAGKPGSKFLSQAGGYGVGLLATLAEADPTIPKFGAGVAKASKELLSLAEEAKKYKSAEEFVRAQFSKKPEYGMSHRPTYEGMPPAHNLLEGNAIPKDVYEHPEWSIASGRSIKTDQSAKESWSALQKIRDNPDAEITVYRAGKENKLNTGDWITFSKNYAKDSLEGDVEKVHSFKIKAKDAVFAGDDINEFGYYPKDKLTDIWNKAAPDVNKQGLAAFAQLAQRSPNPDQFISSLGKTFNNPDLLSNVIDRVYKAGYRSLADFYHDATQSKLTGRPNLEITTPAVKTGIEELHNKELELEMLKEVVSQHPAASLAKYEIKKGDFKGQLPEVSPNQAAKGTEKNDFAKRGDEMVSELGIEHGYEGVYQSSEDARAGYQEYKDLNARYQDMKQEVATLREDLQKSRLSATTPSRIINRQNTITDRALKQELEAQKQGLREGLMTGRREAAKTKAETYKATANAFRDRMRNKLAEVQRRFELGDLKDTIMTRVIAQFKQEIVDYAKTNLPLRERGKLLAVVKNAKTQQAVDQAVIRVTDLAEEAASRTLRSQVIRELKTITPKKVSGIPRGKFDANTQAKLTRVKEIVAMPRAEAGEKIIKNIESAGEEGLAPDKIIENELLAMAGVKEQGSQELLGTLENIRSLKEQGRTLRELYLFNRESNLQQARAAVIDEVAAGRKTPRIFGGEPNKSLFANIAENMDWLHGMDTLMEMLSNKPGERFSGPLHTVARQIHNARTANLKGMEDTTTGIQAAYDRIFKVNTPKARKAVAYANKQEHSLGTFNKIELRFSQDMAFKKWMELQDPTLDETFSKMGWTPEMTKALEDFMTPETKQWGEWQLNDFYQNYYPGVNEVFSRKYGVNLPFNSKYSPLFRDGIDTSKTAESLMIDDLKKFYTGRPGSIKSRVNSTKPLKFVDGNQVLMRHVAEMEHFKAFEEPLSDVRAIFGNPEVRQIIKENHGQMGNTAIDKILSNVALDGRDTAGAIGWLDNWRGNFTKSVLGINPLIALKQMTSIPAYITHMPGGAVSGTTDFFRYAGDFWRDPVNNMKTLMESPFMRARYDLGTMERDVRQAMSQGDHSFTGREAFKDWMLSNVKIGDKASVLQGGWAVYKSNLQDYLKRGMSETTAKRMAMQQFERATARTQQSGLPEDLSMIQTTGGSWGKIMSMFISQPQQYFRLVATSVHDYNVGRGSKAQNIRDLVLLWVVLPSLFQWVSDGFTWQQGRQTRAAIMGPLDGIPAIGDLFNTVVGAVTGDDTPGNSGQIPIVSTADVLKQGIQKMLKKEPTVNDILTAVEKLATAAGQFTGYPVGPALSLATGTKEAILSGDPRKALFSGFALNEGQARPPLLSVPQPGSHELQNYNKTVKEKQDQNRSDAEKLNEELKKMSPEDANTRLQQVPDDLYNALKRVRQKELLNDSDEQLLKYGVTDGSRAREIKKHLDLFDSREEKNAYIDDLTNKKVISDTVYKQLQELIQGNNAVEPDASGGPGLSLNGQQGTSSGLSLSLGQSAYAAELPQGVQLDQAGAVIDPVNSLDLSEAEYNLFNGESGFKPEAQNPGSSAFGLWQGLDSTRHKYGAELGIDPNTTDPEEQLAMARAYIEDTYGDADRAWGFWQATVGHNPALAPFDLRSKARQWIRKGWSGY